MPPATRHIRKPTRKPPRMSSPEAPDKKSPDKEAPAVSEAKAAAAPAAEAKSKPHDHRVIVRACPKIVVYYPTVLAAIICGFISYFMSENTLAMEIVGEIFIIVLFFNTIILAFEFPR